MQSHLARALAVLLFFFLEGIARAQEGEVPAMPTQRPAIERCRDFCSTIYGSGSAERGQCADACADAEVCAKKCEARFPDDKGQQAACLKQCMRARPAADACRPDVFGVTAL